MKIKQGLRDIDFSGSACSGISETPALFLLPRAFSSHANDKRPDLLSHPTTVHGDDRFWDFNFDSTAKTPSRDEQPLGVPT